MASRAASSAVFLLLATFAAGASAATFNIRNNCGYTVWPAGIPVGGGVQLDPRQSWTVYVPPGRGHCDSGDCAGALSCTLSGQTPATLAEYTIGANGAQDFYDISLVDGFNQPMDFSYSTGVNLHCPGAGCPDAYLYPTDDTKTHACASNSNYQVTFCASSRHTWWNDA
ncbi:unnamed protein product [Urochloa decumbens]|uniref:Thaumatin-like protein n=1 Tax=Urochloa decumbens TaxID=240449 RepID=A0ABC9H0I8_9POAL